ncbi:MAG: ADP-forming succinate--CoA ligase subunit beta [Hyphomicrobiales bacterium]|jgi:succinyl-CoA synthetase beta subunit|nr:ADP-forming succinate--CoA ligase subunit beta [Alphaproteobacteria bacterium]MDG1153014.1 ADP-forming succinate--CoA ligase subunit beta [Hyphomicrobiales bacterium]MBT5662451.1 ADP-forming succinate--CoA ligase subunit beta [Alphaproteobacteria bacterium]MDG1523945.1 ADP-forming succinate--CoA ligase subunit beta [Hyphomicrobiales bacterium]MDG1665499.1 ADP-forming succinate--CoA ligase subunit beta [Hyphomicrobiales bacterium]|tara:strand:+ start:1707 stop:2876 length:1170 start_codon:yes stop_codon:yes gene_type:complete
MNIHEYQAKELLKKYNVPTVPGFLALDPESAVSAAEKIGGDVWVVKAQIHAGGRGKGGGVKVVKSLDEVKNKSDEILGMNLVTHQTGPKGQEVRKVYIEKGTNIVDELYLSIVVDRANSRVNFIASTEGGMDIEEVAENSPEKILTVDINPSVGIDERDVISISKALGLDDDLLGKSGSLLKNLYNAFVETDMSLLEINPLVLTGDRELVCLDAKVNFDDNALFRHPDIEELRDPDEEDPAELAANAIGLTYIKLDGNIGCLVNGAGLAMATMDIIKLYGEEPANFLDVGGSATKDKVTEAFKIILSDKNVKGILVNIFGGIMRCDVVAEGVLDAAREINISVPLVVRLEGTNVDEGKRIIEESDLTVISGSDLDDAAQKITKAISGIK